MPLCRITFTRKDCPGTEFLYYDKFDDTMKIGHVTYLGGSQESAGLLEKRKWFSFRKLFRIEDLDHPMK